MSFMDKAKDALTQAKDKAADLAEQHGDKIDKGINKAGDFVDQKTGGKYAEKIDQAQSKARAGADKLAAERPPSATVVPEPTVVVPTVVTPPVVAPAVADPTPDPNVVHPFESESTPAPALSDPLGDDPVAKSTLRGDLAGPAGNRTDPSI